VLWTMHLLGSKVAQPYGTAPGQQHAGCLGMPCMLQCHRGCVQAVQNEQFAASE
jgi:hypothetical protein